ncbi:hypothetical protein ACJ5NV_15815 [Loktanella agnita]|uniref:hypothetical protein n=1 Tax=Loktanella agnita TaxID=287097 RepID=UPI003989E7A6
MTNKKTKPLASKDMKRRAFLPIKTDLLDRLTRECEHLAGGGHPASHHSKADSNRLAA